jgi:LPS sulfotransferase NodH
MIKLPKKFIIFAHPRCGSSTLFNIIKWQANTGVNEPFNQATQDENNYLKDLNEKGIKFTTKKIFYNIQFFKHLSSSIKPEENKYLLDNYKIIFMYRKNILDAAISKVVAEQTNIWHSIDVNYESDYLKIKYVEPKLIDFEIQEIKKHMNYAKMSENVMFVAYEDIFENKYNFFKIEKIFNFLDLHLHRYESIRLFLSEKNKLNKKKWEDVLENYSDIKNQFQYSVSPIQ